MDSCRRHSCRRSWDGDFFFKVGGEMKTSPSPPPAPTGTGGGWGVRHVVWAEDLAEAPASPVEDFFFRRGWGGGFGKCRWSGWPSLAESWSSRLPAWQDSSSFAVSPCFQCLASCQKLARATSRLDIVFRFMWKSDYLAKWTCWCSSTWYDIESMASTNLNWLNGEQLMVWTYLNVFNNLLPQLWFDGIPHYCYHIQKQIQASYVYNIWQPDE